MIKFILTTFGEGDIIMDAYILILTSAILIVNVITLYETLVLRKKCEECRKKVAKN